MHSKKQKWWIFSPEWNDKVLGFDISWAQDKENIWVSNRMWTHGLPHSCSNNWLFKGNMATVKRFKSSRIRCDEGLTVEASALECLYGGLPYQTLLIKPNAPFHSPTDLAPQFLLKLTLFNWDIFPILSLTCSCICLTPQNFHAGSGFLDSLALWLISTNHTTSRNKLEIKKSLYILLLIVFVLIADQ